MKNSTELRDNFQALVTSPSPDPVQLWESYAEWDEAFQREQGSRLPHTKIVLSAIRRREYIDPTTASLGMFGLSLSTVDYSGRIGPLFQGMKPEIVEQAKVAIERMARVGYDPRSLNTDNK